MQQPACDRKHTDKLRDFPAPLRAGLDTGLMGSRTIPMQAAS